MQNKTELQKERKEVFRKVVQGFEHQYSWLGHQAARELLLSVASWNIEKNSDEDLRFRNHVMLAWEKGWVKSTILRQMAGLLGSEMCSTIGKVTDAALRGSVSSGQFTPPKPLKSPIVISTEFGQTNFEDETLNIFLAMLEEGQTNVSLNKLGSLPNQKKKEVEKRYDGKINFGESNEFDLKCDFIFWGGTYDPTKLEDNALRSRFNVVTPEKNLDKDVIEAVSRNQFRVSNDTVRELRRMVKYEGEVDTDFHPPDHLLEELNNIRELRDLRSYMAARNWWGLEVNPKVMSEYIDFMQRSREISTMSPEDRIFDLIFQSPMTLQELHDQTRYSKQYIYKILQKHMRQHNAQKLPGGEKEGDKYVIYSGENEVEEDDQEEISNFLDGV